MMNTCTTCGMKDAQFICSRCHISCYCSKSCQKKDWRAWHKSTCKILMDNQLNDDRALSLQKELVSLVKTLKPHEAEDEIQKVKLVLEQLQRHQFIADAKIKSHDKKPTKTAQKIPPENAKFNEKSDKNMDNHKHFQIKAKAKINHFEAIGENSNTASTKVSPKYVKFAKKKIENLENTRISSDAKVNFEQDLAEVSTNFEKILNNSEKNSEDSRSSQAKIDFKSKSGDLQMKSKDEELEEKLETCQPATWILEKQMNIGIYQLYLTLPSGWQAQSARAFKVSDTCLGVTAVCMSNGVKKRMEKHFHISKGFCADESVICHKEDYVSVRVPFSTFQPGSIQAQEAAAVEEGMALDNDAYKEVNALFCRFCGFQISLNGHLKRALPLPSGRFDDVIDEMICFDGPTAVPMTAREVSYARPNLLLVGQTFVLIHTEDCNSKSMTETSNDDEVESLAKISCSQCNTPLGAKTPMSDLSKGLILLKHRIIGEVSPRVGKSILTRNGSYLEELPQSNSLLEGVEDFPVEKIFASYTAKNYLAMEISRAVEVDRCYRIIVQSDVNRIRLRVISPVCWVATDNDKPVQQAIKMYFVEEISTVASAVSHSDQTVQFLTVQMDEYVDMRDALRKMSNIIPQSYRCEDITKDGSCLTFLFL